MKAIFKDIFSRIKTVNSIKWIDEDFGQIDDYKDRPAVQFPCTLVSINSRFTHQAGSLYEVDQDITIRIAFNRLGDRSPNASSEAIETTLSKLDIVDELVTAMEGYYSTDISKLYLLSIDTERRTDGLSVKIIRFKDNSDFDAGA